MTNRVALIAGGAKGIGRAIGLRLAKDGWTIALCYRKSGDAAVEAVNAIRAEGAEALSVQCDVSDPAACKDLVDQVLAKFGAIHALINCAGPYHRVPLLEETIEGWSEMFDNNLHPVFYLSRLVAPIMKEQKWGRLINFSMANADRMVAQPQVTAHYIAKSGILILTRTLAKVLGPHGITANAISPGFINSGSAPEEELQSVVKNIPAGYVGDLEDAVSVACFLLSDEARYVNGANLHLSGGWGV